MRLLRTALALTFVTTPLFVVVAGVAPAFAQAPAAPAKVSGKPTINKSGLSFYDLKVGTGAVAKAGDYVQVQYTGWLTNGTKFDSSLDRKEAFEFKLGSGMVIKGWDEGVAGMKAGGKRQLHIPAAMAYGPKSVGGVIPPNSDLVFDVELIGTSTGPTQRGY